MNRGYVESKLRSVRCTLRCRKLFHSRAKGLYLPAILLTSVIFLAYIVAIVSLSLSNVKMAELHNKKITAMAIAEAGINYYMWHLAHNNTDYCNGQPCVGSPPYGPFLHDYTDQSGQVLGSYELFITPPDPGGSVTTVKAVGKVSGQSPRRTIIAEIGIPAYTKYTLATNNSQLWIGSGEKIEGTVHVNHNGLYNEGEITGDASSTETTYNGWFGTQPGVSGPGVFGGAKLFPVVPINFNQLSVDILNLRNNARDGGQGHHYDSSNSRGYHIVLNANNYHLYIVRKFNNTGYDIDQEDLIGTYEYPESGIIFCEDDVWVNGTIDDQRITIVAADPDVSGNQEKRIIIPGLVTYTNYDGTDKIGLITQTDILVSRNAPFNMEIDAAMIAQDGEIRINNYGQIKGNMKVYGSMAHNTGLVWTYGNPSSGQVVSGYSTTETLMDYHNVLNPPPQFPTTGAYAILSWREE